MIYYPPLLVMPDIPVGNHFGSFGVQRKHDYHTGVDLYGFYNKKLRKPKIVHKTF